MDHFAPEGASERALAGLNGKSIGSTPLWDCQPGDYLVAKITFRDSYRSRHWGGEYQRLELLIEEGTECGKRLGPSTHRVLLCSHAELQAMIRRLDPQPEDALILAYFGRDDSQRPSRHRFRYSLERAPELLEAASHGTDF